MSTNRVLSPIPDLSEIDRAHISRLTQILEDGKARREREKNWKEYTSKDGSMIVSYEVVDHSYEVVDHSYDDEMGRVEKYCVEIRKVMADVTLNEEFSGLIEDLRIEIEAEYNE